MQSDFDLASPSSDDGSSYHLSFPSPTLAAEAAAPASLKRKRGRPPKTDKERQAVDPEVLAEKKERRRTKNREAAQRSREKKKRRVDELQSNIDELEADNQRLRALVARLQQDLQQSNKVVPGGATTTAATASACRNTSANAAPLLSSSSSPLRPPAAAFSYSSPQSVCEFDSDADEKSVSCSSSPSSFQPLSSHSSDIRDSDSFETEPTFTSLSFDEPSFSSSASSSSSSSSSYSSASSSSSLSLPSLSSFDTILGAAGTTSHVPQGAELSLSLSDSAVVEVSQQSRPTSSALPLSIKVPCSSSRVLSAAAAATTSTSPSTSPLSLSFLFPCPWSPLLTVMVAMMALTPSSISTTLPSSSFPLPPLSPRATSSSEVPAPIAAMTSRVVEVSKRGVSQQVRDAAASETLRSLWSAGVGAAATAVAAAA